MSGVDSDMLAASLQLEEELNRALRALEHDHGALLRRACQVPPEHEDLWAITVTTMFGHVLSLMRKARGREATERLAVVLLDQFEIAAERAATLRVGEGTPNKDSLH